MRKEENEQNGSDCVDEQEMTWEIYEENEVEIAFAAESVKKVMTISGSTKELVKVGMSGTWSVPVQPRQLQGKEDCCRLGALCDLWIDACVCLHCHHHLHTMIRAINP
jgi:hypothetical protein